MYVLLKDHYSTCIHFRWLFNPYNREAIRTMANVTKIRQDARREDREYTARRGKKFIGNNLIAYIFITTTHTCLKL